MSDAATTATIDTGPGDRAPLSAWYALGVLLMTAMFAFIDRQILSLVMPDLQRDFGLSDMQLGMLQGLGMAIFAGVAGYPMGWLADRYGRRLMLIIGIVIWSLATAACGFQTSFTGIFLCTIGIAVGEAGLTPIIFAFLPDLFGARQRHMANFIVFGSSLFAASIGVGLSGAALQWLTLSHASLPAALATFEPWRLAMMTVALPAPIFILLVATLPVARSNRREVSGEARPPIAPFAPFLMANRKTFACIFGAIGGYALSINAAFAWLPLAASRAFGLTAAEAGIQMSGVMAAGALLGILLPMLGMRLPWIDISLRPLRMAAIFATLTILPTIALCLVTSATQLFVAAAAQLAFCLATAACMPSIVQDFSPPSLRARILSLVSIVSALSLAISAIAIGAMSGAIGSPRGILIGMALIETAGLLLAVLLLLLAVRPFMATVRSLR